MDLAYWWSFIAGWSAINGATPSCLTCLPSRRASGDEYIPKFYTAEDTNETQPHKQHKLELPDAPAVPAVPVVPEGAIWSLSRRSNKNNPPQVTKKYASLCFNEQKEQLLNSWKEGKNHGLNVSKALKHIYSQRNYNCTTPPGF